MAAQVTTLASFLDLAVCPVSFDAVIFMAQAEMERRKANADRLHVILFGDMRKKSQYDEAEAEWRLWNIAIPAAHLFGAEVTYTADRDFAMKLSASAEAWWPPPLAPASLKNRQHLVGGLIRRVRDGAEIARPRASEYARRACHRNLAGTKGLVTMTKRRTYLNDRNSDDAVWWNAAHQIGRRGYIVAMIEDTRIALENGEGFAELNLDLRMAMYQEAAFNVCANTGPASLLWLSDRPYVMMGAGVPADEWDGLFVKQGLPLGESWPWALPNQRIAYGKETAEQILAEFERWESATN